MVRCTKSDPPLFFASFSPTGQVLEQQNPKYKCDKHEGEAYGCEQLECPRMEGHSILNAKRSLIYLDQTTLKESLDKRSPRQHSLVRVRFHGVADLMIGALEGIGHYLVVAFEGCGGIAVEGCCNFFRNDIEVNAFRMEDTINIGKMMHELLGLLQLWRNGIAATATGV